VIILFMVVAIAAVASAILVITVDNPVHSALALVSTLLSVAVFYAMLNAPFLAIIQVAVYAGAIMVLFLFVIMLLNLRREEGAVRGPLWARVTGLLFALAIVVCLCIAVMGAPGHPAVVGSVYRFGSPQEIGHSLFESYLIPFEVTSLLLTVAMVGAILLARRKF